MEPAPSLNIEPLCSLHTHGTDCHTYMHATIEDAFRALLQAMEHHHRYVVICDERLKLFVEFPPQLAPHFIVGNEHCKSWEQVRDCLSYLTQQRLTRGDAVIAVGGGALCDMVSFASAIYLRGIAHYLVPSTLLAMVDAAIGGKNGINFLSYKNTVGTFRLPRAIHITPPLLDSLPDDEFQNGFAEIIKAGMIGDRRLFDVIESALQQPHGILSLRKDAGTMLNIVQAAIRVKNSVVQQDFSERGVRAHLNLGHTFGHALESVMGVGGVRHGAAVLWGIAQALHLGLHLNITPIDYASRVLHVLIAMSARLDYPHIAPSALLAAMEHDKKRVDANLTFIVQRGIEHTVIETVDREAATWSLEHYPTLFNEQIQRSIKTLS